MMVGRAASAAAVVVLLVTSGCADEWLAPAPLPDSDAGGEPDPCQLAREQTPARVESIVVGDKTACAVTNLGSMYCWGEPAGGATGISGDVGYIETPLKAPDHHCLRTLALGYAHGCGLTYDA